MAKNVSSRKRRNPILLPSGDSALSTLLICLIFIGSVLLVFGMSSSSLSNNFFPVTPTPTPKLLPNSIYGPTALPGQPTTTIVPSPTDTIPTITSMPAPPIPPTTSGNYTCGATISPGTNVGSALAGTNGVLCLHGGTYTGNFTLDKPGATIVAVHGERPIISGQTILSGNNMTIDGINFTWNTSLSSSDHMVKLLGSGITLKNGEIWGAHSYAGLQVSNGASGWKVQNMYIHDTYPSNSTNQDHLIYVNNASNGLIERCLFVNSPNGRGIKLGPPSGSGGPTNITIRYNTFYNNLGPANIQLSGDTSGTIIDHNIMQKPSSGMQNVTVNSLNGSGNVVTNNVWWESSGLIEPGGNIQDGGGNVHIDPQLGIGSDFRPGNPQATAYGRYAP